MRECINIPIELPTTQIWKYHFFCSDLHFGDKNFDKELFVQEFDEAKNLDANIYINGDVLDMIFFKDFKRYQPENDKYGHSAYANKITKEAEDLLMPYVNNITVLGCGNHEVEFQKRHGLDVISLIIGNLNRERDTNLSPIYHGGYAGFVRISYSLPTSRFRCFDIFYNHGQGTKADVTKGTIDIARYSGHKFVDLLWLSHKHNKFVMPAEKVQYIDSNGKINTKTRHAIMTGCYRKPDIQDIKDNGGVYNINYQDEKSRSMEATGGIMMKQCLYYTKTGKDRKRKINTKFIC